MDKAERIYLKATLSPSSYDNLIWRVRWRWIIALVVVFLLVFAAVFIMYPRTHDATNSDGQPTLSPKQHSKKTILPEWDFTCVWHPLECLSPSGYVIEEAK